MRRELICVAPATPPRLEVRTGEVPLPGAGHLLVRVAATSVNPIDAKRAAGYGRRLLRLKGAASFPLVLGNDVAGTVEALGSGVSRFAPGQRVFGLMPTGKRDGAHATHVVVPEELLLAAADDADLEALAVLPYTFTTMWLAVRSAGLHAQSAEGRRVLVNGASGGLGRLAIQLMCRWGGRVTAICGQANLGHCLALGAETAVERGPATIRSLSADFDAVLNFGSWSDDYLLASRLAPGALGHATTVHPLLPNFDRLGWWRGALASRREWKEGRTAVRERAPGARYSWTLFKPDREALDALVVGLRERTFSLPVGICTSLDNAATAFAHVDAGRSGRAVLLPHGDSTATSAGLLASDRQAANVTPRTARASHRATNGPASSALPRAPAFRRSYTAGRPASHSISGLPAASYLRSKEHDCTCGSPPAAPQSGHALGIKLMMAPSSFDRDSSPAAAA